MSKYEVSYIKKMIVIFFPLISLGLFLLFFFLFFYNQTTAGFFFCVFFLLISLFGFVNYFKYLHNAYYLKNESLIVKRLFRSAEYSINEIEFVIEDNLIKIYKNDRCLYYIPRDYQNFDQLKEKLIHIKKESFLNIQGDLE